MVAGAEIPEPIVSGITCGPRWAFLRVLASLVEGLITKGAVLLAVPTASPLGASANGPGALR